MAIGVRILVVDDIEPWRRLVASMFRTHPELEIVCEVADGLEAVQKAEELQPDLVLLDIGLPQINGLEAATRIRKVSPKTRIIFVSQEVSTDVVLETFRIGAAGYVVKVDAGSELLNAVDTVLRGKRFVGSRFSGLALPQQNLPTGPDCHEVAFYSHDRFLLNHLTQFIGTALKAKHAAIVIATESHRNSLLLSLQGYGVDAGAEIERGRCILLDAAETLSALMVNGMLDEARFLTSLADLIGMGSKAAEEEHAPVAVYGECVQLLWAQENIEAVIQLEKAGNELIKTHNADILCGYSPGIREGGMDRQTSLRICAEHSAVHQW